MNTFARGVFLSPTRTFIRRIPKVFGPRERENKWTLTKLLGSPAETA